MKQKADRTAISKLESEKADKIYVEREFESVQRELDELRDQLSRLNDTVKRSDLLERVEKLEDLVN